MRLCIDLETGDVLRKIPAKHDISSPIMIGRHILCYEINGSFLQLLEADRRNSVTVKNLRLMH